MGSGGGLTAKSKRLRLCVLGSGSGGNSTVISPGNGAPFLIDAGLSPRATARRLTSAGLDLADVRAILLTHLDRDHFRLTWLRVIRDLGIRVFLSRWHAPDWPGDPAEVTVLNGNRNLFVEQRDFRTVSGLAKVIGFGEAPFDVEPGVTVRTCRLQHDRQGTTGFRITDRRGGSVGYATDLGHAPPSLIRLCAGVDLLCIEANYDEKMTTQSARPSFVNRRNLSDSGHLSNEQSLEAVRRIFAASPQPPRRVVLMHRSSLCNHPTKVRRVFATEPMLQGRITLAEQRRRTGWIQAPHLAAVRRAQWPLPWRSVVADGALPDQSLGCATSVSGGSGR